MRSAQVRSSAISAPRIAAQARGPSISSITMIVRIVMAAAMVEAALVTAPTMVS